MPSFGGVRFRGIARTNFACNEFFPLIKVLLRYQHKLVRDTVRMKNRNHNIMAKNSLDVLARDLFGKKGLAFLSDAKQPLYGEFG